MLERKKRKKTAPKGGFTLLEVLIATAIFTFGALAVFAVQMQAIRTTAAARNLQEATRLAQYPIEAFKTLRFNEIYNFVTSGTSRTYSTTTAPSFTAGSSTQEIMTVWYNSIRSSFPGSGVGTLTVQLERVGTEDKTAKFISTVTWRDQKGNHQVRVESVLANAFY